MNMKKLRASDRLKSSAFLCNTSERWNTKILLSLLTPDYTWNYDIT